MDRRKQLFIALLVLGVLIGAALLVWRDPFEKASRTDYSALLPARPEGTIDRIVVTNKEGSITAEKRGEIWWIIAPGEFSADDGQLKAAASSLEKLTVVDTVSKKQERHSEYGLAKDSPERIEVKAFTGATEVMNLAAGKRTPENQGTFVALTKDSNTVYVTSEALPFLLAKGVNVWRSKVLVDLPRETIDRIRITNTKGTLDLEKGTGDTWKKKDDPAWQTDNVRFGQVLGAFSRLSWVEVVDEPDPAFDYGFKAPPATVTATAGGKDHLLTFGKDVEGSQGRCWLQLAGDLRVYQVNKAILDRFTRDFDYYRGEAAKPGQEEPNQPN
jgi:hypothetical protein